MRSKFTLLSTAAALAFGLAGTAALAADATGDAPGAKSDITIVTDTGNAPATGVEESTQSQGATNKQGLNDSGTMPPASGAGSEQGGGALSSDQGGTGIKGSEQSQGATNKSTEDPGAKTGMNQGSSTGNTGGDTGVEKSTEGQGAQNKTY